MADANATGNEILLEAGTNEVEILVFQLGNRHFGVNVAKVREVIRSVPIHNVPHKHDAVVGLFEIRGSILTLIDLAGYLGIRPCGAAGNPPPASQSEASAAFIGDAPASTAPKAKTSTDEAPSSDAGAGGEAQGPAYLDRSIVVTEFNGQRLGFLIDAVERIHRVSWGSIKPVPRTNLAGEGGDRGVTNGVVMIDETLVLLVDFESVADIVLDDRRLHVTSVRNETGLDRERAHIVLADDSSFMRSAMRRALETSGFKNFTIATDGEQAWAEIDKRGESIDVIVSDIEMPGMDGLALTKRVREDSRFAKTPIVLFSSLVSGDNANKGKRVGATLQIPKPELPELVRIIDHLAAGLDYVPSKGAEVHGADQREAA